MYTIAYRLIKLGNLLLFYTVLLMANIATAAGSTEVLKVTIPPIEQSAHTSVYFQKLLQLALTKTQSTDGPFEIVQYPDLLTKARFEAELKRRGVIDVIWATSNKDLETELLPIRVSLLKDLNSYRIFLIRKEDQEKFTRVKTLNDLRSLKAGQGVRWADTDILIANDLPVVTSPLFEPLFNMLAGKRFDYFPRGLGEIWSEEELFSNKGLGIEQHLLLKYHTTKYFFVNKKNTALADRIERGLKIAMADGSFDTLFNSIPGFRKGQDEIANKKRLVIELKIPH